MVLCTSDRNKTTSTGDRLNPPVTDQWHEVSSDRRRGCTLPQLPHCRWRLPSTSDQNFLSLTKVFEEGNAGGGDEQWRTGVNGPCKGLFYKHSRRKTHYWMRRLTLGLHSHWEFPTWPSSLLPNPPPSLVLLLRTAVQTCKIIWPVTVLPQNGWY